LCECVTLSDARATLAGEPHRERVAEQCVRSLALERAIHSDPVCRVRDIAQTAFVTHRALRSMCSGWFVPKRIVPFVTPVGYLPAWADDATVFALEERVTMLERQMPEMRDLPGRVTSLESQVLQLRQWMRDEFSATRAEFRSELAGAVTTLANVIADTNTQMRTLREDAISRIATSERGDGRGKSGRASRRV
jgi:hypothetical protein